MSETDSDATAQRRGLGGMVVGMAGAAISVAAIPFSSMRMTTGRAILASALLLVHAAACIGYYLYVQHNPADTALYYFDVYHFDNTRFHFGTILAVKFTQVLKKDFGGSYLECFVFFQSIGFWGLMLLMRSFQEISFKMRAAEAVLPTYLLFLPSVHFWTVAIGKDAPLFFAVSLCVWSALNWRSRIVAFMISIFVMVLFRAHIALIALMSLAAAGVLHPGTSFGRKAGLLGITVAGALLLAGTVQSTLNVDVTNASSIASFLAERNEIAGKIGGHTTFGDASILVRFLSLLFRPFFFDATNILGIIASVENIGSVLLFAYLIKKWRSIRFLSKRVFFVEYCATFSFILIVLLTAVNYNVGLGLRERMMIVPPLFCVFVAAWLIPGRSTQPLSLFAALDPVDEAALRGRAAGVPL